MKYVFLILLIVVAFGSYKYYGKMQQDFDALCKTEQEECITALGRLYDRAEALSAEYDALERQMSELESARDADVARLQQVGRERFARLYEGPKSELPATASRQRRDQNRRLINDSIRAREAMETAEKRHIALEKDLLARIAGNRREAAEKIQQAYRELSEKSIKQFGTRKIRKEILDEKAMALESSVNRINMSIRQQIEESRKKLETTKVMTLRRLQEIDEQIMKLYSTPAGAAKPVAEPEADGTTRLAAMLDEFDTEMRDSRLAYTKKAEEIRKDLYQKQSALRATVIKAEKLLLEHDEKLAGETETHERHLLYVKIIGWGLSICLAVGTVFVFIGSRKVDDEPRPLY